jgi:hypothetical protein
MSKPYKADLANSSQHWQEFCDKLNNSVRLLNEAFTAFSLFLNETVIPEFTASVKIMYDSIYQTYLDAGAPYGKNHKGLVIWLKEMQNEEKQDET